jgi:hypothetical protein
MDRGRMCKLSRAQKIDLKRIVGDVNPFVGNLSA